MQRLTVLSFLFATVFSYADTLTIATPPHNPPFVMISDRQKHYEGYSIEIMDAVCKQLQVTCLYTSMGFEETFTAVMNDTAKFAVGNLTITPERETYVAFSLPYLRSEAQFITLSARHFSSINDLRNKVIGAEENSLIPDLIKAQFSGEARVATYTNVSDMMLALSQGTVDGVLIDRQTAEYWFSNNGTLFQLLGGSVPMGQGIAIMGNKANTALMKQVNTALMAMEADGTYLRIFNTYFSDTHLIP